MHGWCGAGADLHAAAAGGAGGGDRGTVGGARVVAGVMDCRVALKHAATGTLVAIADRVMWAGILAGVVATVVLLVRLLVLATFPVSTPLIAWMLIHDERRRRSSSSRRARGSGMASTRTGRQPDKLSITAPCPRRHKGF